MAKSHIQQGKSKIDWEDNYNDLRIVHSIIKGLTREHPYWFSKEKKLPKNYATILCEIDDLLYKAEQYCAKLIK